MKLTTYPHLTLMLRMHGPQSFTPSYSFMVYTEMTFTSVIMSLMFGIQMGEISRLLWVIDFFTETMQCLLYVSFD